MLKGLLGPSRIVGSTFGANIVSSLGPEQDTLITSCIVDLGFWETAHLCGQSPHILDGVSLIKDDSWNQDNA